MCGPSDTDDLVAVARGRAAADAILDALGVPVANALDLSTARGFDAAVAHLAAELRRRASQRETDAFRAAVAVLDIDWRETSPAQRRARLNQAREASGRALDDVPRRIEAPLGRAAERVVASTRSAARRDQRLAIAADFNAVDRRAVAFIRRSTALFIPTNLGGASTR